MTEVNDMSIKPCPCGGMPVWDSSDNGDCYWLLCNRGCCNFCGPSAQYLAEAIKAWNSKVEAADAKAE